MDRGHVKKMKLANKMGRDNPGYNPFQELENKNNQQQQQGNGFRPHSMHRDNPHHPPHKMNNGQSRSWVNNDRPSGSYSKHKYSQPSYKNRPQKQWGRRNFKKHGNNRFNGNFSRSNNYNHSNGRPNN